MKLAFTKMQGLGNDFVVFDGVRQRVTLNADQCRFLADRRFGIGCDQILLVEPPRLAGTDFPLPHLQRRRLRGGTVRQRRPLLRPLRARPGADGQDRDPGGHRRRPHPPLHRGRRPGAGQHGRTPLRPRRASPSWRRRRRTATTWRWTARPYGSAPSPWATPTPCCGSMTWTRPPSPGWAPSSKAIRASPGGSTPASCRSWTQATSGCGSSSAAPARPWPAAPAPAPPWRWAVAFGLLDDSRAGESARRRPEHRLGGWRPTHLDDRARRQRL
jgi:hypothetical protein